MKKKKNLMKKMKKNQNLWTDRASDTVPLLAQFQSLKIFYTIPYKTHEFKDYKISNNINNINNINYEIDSINNTNSNFHNKESKKINLKKHKIKHKIL